MTEKDRDSPPDDSAGTASGFGPGDHIDEDVCTDIIAGLISGDRLGRIMSHVDSCRTCEIRLITAAGDRETFRAGPVFGNSERPVRLPAIPNPAGRGSLFPRRIPILRLAVPMALAAGLLFIVLARRSDSPREKELSYWLPATGEILRLRAAHSGDADSAFWIGLNAYEEHDVPTAMARLQDSKTTGGLEDLRRLHLASLLVNSGRAEEAVKLLEEMEIEYLPLPWREDARWTEYLALLAVGQSRLAGERLDEMATWPGRIGDMARERKARTGH